MIVAMTGHRPEKMKASRGDIEKAVSDALLFVKADYLIQGMAAGVDLWSAHVAYLLQIPYECAVPWRTHEARSEDKSLYAEALKHADKITYVNEADSYLGPWLYQRRNEYMVDNCDNVLAVWDGGRGGTHNAVQYALKINKPTWRLDPNHLDKELEWLNG